MRRYETILVLRSDLPEAQLKDTLKRFEGVLTAGGAHLVTTEDWGVREMAYKIRREHRGQYFRLDYVASPATVNELERNLKLSDVVLRYLSVVTDVRPDLSKLKEQTQVAAQPRLAASETAGESGVAAGEVEAPATEASAQAEQVTPPTAAESGVEQN